MDYSNKAKYKFTQQQLFDGLINSNLQENIPKSRQVIIYLPYDITYSTLLKQKTTSQELLDDANAYFRKELKRQNINDTRKILSLETINKIESLDYIMSFPDRELSDIESGDKINAVMEVSDKASMKGSYLYIKMIGVGGFSKVYEVRDIRNGKLYAMKVISKASVEKSNKVKQIISEKKIMEKMNHPFIIKLHSAFQTNRKLHFVMDLCPGGELFYHLHRVGMLSEENAQFYLVEIIMGIEYLHKMHIIYRDLKPENVLIDLDGHIRIADFGLSKESIDKNSLTYSFCGSPEYMSPEMLEQKGHSLTVDYYSIGAILYEMVTGLPPYYSKNQDIMYDQILHSKLEFPSKLSKEAQDLMSKLLQKNPTKRMGYEKGINEIKEHPWFKNVDWIKYYNKQIKPPFSVNKRTTNFDPQYSSNSIDSEDQYLRQRRSTSYYEASIASNNISGISIEESFKADKIESPYENSNVCVIDGEDIISNKKAKATHTHDPLSERGVVMKLGKNKSNLEQINPELNFSSVANGVSSQLNYAKINMPLDGAYVKAQNKASNQANYPQSNSSISLHTRHNELENKLPAKTPKILNSFKLDKSNYKFQGIISPSIKASENISTGPTTVRENPKLSDIEFQHDDHLQLFSKQGLCNVSTKSIGLQYAKNLKLMRLYGCKNSHRLMSSILNGPISANKGFGYKVPIITEASAIGNVTSTSVINRSCRQQRSSKDSLVKSNIPEPMNSKLNKKVQHLSCINDISKKCDPIDRSSNIFAGNISINYKSLGKSVAYKLNISNRGSNSLLVDESSIGSLRNANYGTSVNNRGYINNTRIKLLQHRSAVGKIHTCKKSLSPCELKSVRKILNPEILDIKPSINSSRVAYAQNHSRLIVGAPISDNEFLIRHSSKKHPTLGNLKDNSIKI